MAGWNVGMCVFATGFEAQREIADFMIMRLCGSRQDAGEKKGNPKDGNMSA